MSSWNQLRYKKLTLLLLSACQIYLSEAQWPSFSAPLQNITVIAGREARIPCVVENLQNYKVAWVHYGEHGSAVLTVSTHVLTTNRRVSVHAERDTWTLVIGNATVTDRGDYMCQVSTVPPQKMYRSLQVLVPPEITRPPRDITVDEGSNATLECGATGDPQPKITWRREEDITPHEENLTDKVEPGVLTLFSVSRANAGAFLCVASNGVPPAVSARVILAVNFRPQLIGKEEAAGWASTGDRTLLECRTEAYPRPAITWTHSGEQIRSGIKIETTYTKVFNTLSRLVIDEVSAKDFGQYKCIAKNHMGETNAIYELKELITTTTPVTTAYTTITTIHYLTTSKLATMTKAVMGGANESLSRNKTSLHEPFFEKTVRNRKEEEQQDPIFLVDGEAPDSKFSQEDTQRSAGSLNRFIQEVPYDQLFQRESYSSGQASGMMMILTLFSGISLWVTSLVIVISV